MPRTDLPYTYRSRKRLKSGIRDYWRFRRDGLDTPLPGDPSRDPAAMRKYADLIDQVERVINRKEAERHTFQFLSDAYLTSAEFNALADITQRDYRRTIEERLLPALREERYDCVNRATIKAIRDAVIAEGQSVRTAHKVKQVASLLYAWADEEDLLPAGFINPAQGIRKLRGQSRSITIWSPEETALFLGACEPFMRTPVMLALYTGQRREDLVRMQWSDVTGNVIRVRQNKTGEPLTIPCHSALTAHLAQIRTKFGGPIIRNAESKPLNANALSAAMNRAVAAIDAMPHRTLHGLRYAAAGALEEAGCSVVEITSIIGHRTYTMAIKYARQRRDAEAAIAKLERTA